MLKLSELHHDSFSPGHPVALDGTQILDWQQFIADISAVRTMLKDRKQSRWALFHADSYRFATALFALLAEDKTVYLPGENHAGITADLQAQTIDLIGEFPATHCIDLVSGRSAAPAEPFDLQGRIVIYTSGSTGAAKPIEKTLNQLDSELQALESQWGTQWTDPVVAGTVSHQHFYGLLFSLLWPVCAGRRFCAKPFIDPKILARTTNDLGEAVWVMSPAHLHRLPGNMPWDEARKNVAQVFSSGGPLQLEAAQQVNQALGQLPVEVLGSSETGGIAYRQQRNSTVYWQPLPAVEVRLSDQGALTVRAPWLEDSHWYETTDLATLCPGGTFKLGMRADRIIKLEGKRIALPEVEAVLLLHPWVDDAFVLVVPRKRQVLGAVLVLSDVGRNAEADKGRHVFTRELRQFLRQRISTAAIPRLWRLTPILPRNPQGKILAQTVRELFDRPPLPAVLSQTNTESGCSIVLRIDRDNPYFEGHFPEHAVLPGMVQLLWAQHFARESLALEGVFAGMKTIKFRELVSADTELSLSLKYEKQSGRLYFHYDSKDGRHSQGILLYEDKT
jgi:hypothetical protein